LKRVAVIEDSAVIAKILKRSGLYPRGLALPDDRLWREVEEIFAVLMMKQRVARPRVVAIALVVAGAADVKLTSRPTGETGVDVSNCFY